MSDPNIILASPLPSNLHHPQREDWVLGLWGNKRKSMTILILINLLRKKITGTLVLLDVMAKHNCKNIVFSSSATVYGDPKKVPITEDMELHATNPYGRTKLFLEEIFRDLAVSDKCNYSSRFSFLSTLPFPALPCPSLWSPSKRC